MQMIEKGIALVAGALALLSLAGGLAQAPSDPGAVVRQATEAVRGDSAGELRRLAPDAIERGLAALDRFRRIAESFGASIDAVGTSALREAFNRDEFVRRARDEVGVDVDVVAGVEEARLIHLGVLQAVPMYDRRIVALVGLAIGVSRAVSRCRAMTRCARNRRISGGRSHVRHSSPRHAAV